MKAALPYNGAMERFVDKLVTFGCCAACAVALVFGGGFGTAVERDSAAYGMLVASLLVAVIYVFGVELAPRRMRKATSVAGLCVFAGISLAVPAAAVFLPLVAYDAVFRSCPAWVVVAAVPLALHGLLGVLPSACILTIAAVEALTFLVAVRTKAAMDGAAKNQRARDAMQEHSLELEFANRNLLERQEREARVAVLEERGRIAREIHDNVGHLLTRGILQVEAFQVVHAQDELVRSEFAQVGDTLHEALDTVRDSVHDLRDDSIDLSVQVAAIAEASPVPVHSEISVEDAPSEVSACLTSVIREAISNASRHGNATRVDLTLVEHPGLWQLRVRDNGALSPSMPSEREHAPRQRGMGLQSMEERVRQLGGTFRSGYRLGGGPAGFEIFASIPKRKGRAQ